MAKQKAVLINWPDKDLDLLAWIKEQAVIEERPTSGMIRLLLKLGRRMMERGEPLIDDAAEEEVAPYKGTKTA